MRLLPIQGRVNGHNAVVTHAKVDEADYEWAIKFKWHLAEGYAARSQRMAPKGQPRSVMIFRLHREILGLKHGDPLEGDHINLDKLDNRRCNLRILTSDEQAQNRPAKRNARSGFRGVCFRKDIQARPWQACIRVGGKLKSLGSYSSPEEAGRIAAEARRKLFPFDSQVPISGGNPEGVSS